MLDTKDFLAIRALSNGTYRTEKFQGTDYIVVPVVALVEGVIQGITADQPELALASEFGRYPVAWNGRPITIDHPWVKDNSVEGEIVRVSANSSPEVQEGFQVGFIFNTKVDGTKLTMEAWIDPVKAHNHSEAARALMAKIRKGEKIEVSTGLFTGSEITTGTYGDKEYFGVWRGVVPDHLALLPGDLVGACSNADGCGVYANAKPLANSEFRAHMLKASCSCGGNTPNSEGASQSSQQTPSAINAALLFKPEQFLANLVTGGLLDNDVRSILQSALDDKYPGAYAYLVGFTDQYAVFSMYDTIDGSRDTYQCGYTIDSSTKAATFADDCVEVILTTEITVAPDPGDSTPAYKSPKDLSANPNPINQSQETQMTVKANATPAPGTPVTAASARTLLVNFGHKLEALNAMKDEDVLAMHATVEQQLAAYAKTPAAKAEDAKDGGKDDDEEDANGKKKKPAMNSAAAPAAPVTTEQYLASAPAGIRESIEAGMRMHAQHKTTLVQKILANARNKFTDAQLNSFDVPTLENLAELAVVPDYSGLASGGTIQTHAAPQENIFQAPTPPSLFQKKDDTPRGVMKVAS